MIFIVLYILVVAGILFFMHAAKTVSYSPAEIEADYQQQYKEINNIK